jgi:hypothetical protein
MGELMKKIAVALALLIVWYGFLFDLALDAKTSILNIMQSHGITSVDYTVKKYVYNSTSGTGEWVEEPRTIDLTGLFDTLFTLALVIGPIIVVWRVFD